MSKLPETLRRQCCYGKSCGNTNLRLISDIAINPETGQPKTFYQYVRESNDNPYSDWGDEQETLAWVEATKNDLNPEPERT